MLEEEEVLVAAWVLPLSLEALTEDLMAFFSSGDLGKKLYSVLFHDMTVSQEGSNALSDQVSRGKAS